MTGRGRTDMPDLNNANKPERNILSGLSGILPVLAGVAIVILLVMVARSDDIEVYTSRTESGFEKIIEYSCIEEEDANAPIGIRKEYTFTLEERKETDICLAFYTVHQYAAVYVDEENVYRLEPVGKKRLSRTPGCNWVMLPLYREDFDKEVRVEITPVYESFRDREVEFLLGSRLAIYCDRLKRDLPQLLLGAMAVFTGIVFLCVAGCSMVHARKGKSLAALGIFSAMMGLWRLTDTRFTPLLVSDHPTAVFYISVAMLMLGMIPLMKWAEDYFSKTVQCVLDGYCILAAVLCLVQVIFQIVGYADLREMLTITHLVIGAGVFAVLGGISYDHRKYPDKPKRILGNVLLFVCACGVAADIAVFYIKGNSSGLVFTLLAFLLYVVFMGILTMLQYGEQTFILAEQQRQLAEKDRLLAEQERKLTQRRIATMMSQIRSHFIFNVLSTISSYCKSDAKKADQALIRFARYLRRNIRIIEEEGTIDFASELEQVEDYVALEQMRFEDKITFVKDIETTSFQLPPLTIQPIVENAIKHGLLEHGKSGTICLSTLRESDHITILVEDDGAGFDPDKLETEDSVGLKNVRSRLETMVGGSLVIRSCPGEGTTVAITIPLSDGKSEGRNESNLCG